MNTYTVRNSGSNVLGDSSKINPVKVIARYINGNILKGFTLDFFPNKSAFHISPGIDDPSKKGITIHMLDLKAVFFVRDFVGNSSYNENKYFNQDNPFHGRKIEITFQDGEVLVGTTMGYTPNRSGFFIFPADLKSNNLKVFVISAAVKKVRFF